MMVQMAGQVESVEPHVTVSQVYLHVLTRGQLGGDAGETDGLRVCGHWPQCHSLGAMASTPDQAGSVCATSKMITSTLTLSEHSYEMRTTSIQVCLYS